MRASSVMEVQQSSLTAGRLPMRYCEAGSVSGGCRGGEPVPARFDEREEGGQLRLGELEALRVGQGAKRVHGAQLFAMRAG